MVILLNPRGLSGFRPFARASRQAKDTVDAQNQRITEMTAKSSYFDLVLSTTDAVSATAIAKDFGKSAQWLNDLLHDYRVQYRQEGLWVLYQKYADKGYTCTKTTTFTGNDGTIHSKLHTYWTQKGRQFICDLLQSHGYLSRNQ